MLAQSTLGQINIQPPKFITQIVGVDLNEGERAHFEAKLEPTNDSTLRVEWYHNGKPLISGSRYIATHDFGFVSLDILYVYPEDAGEYACIAKSQHGLDITRTTIKIRGKPTLNFQTQLPEGLSQGVQRLTQTEETYKR